MYSLNDGGGGYACKFTVKLHLELTFFFTMLSLLCWQIVHQLQLSMMIHHEPYKPNALESSNCTCTLMQCLKHITFTLNTKLLHTKLS